MIKYDVEVSGFGSQALGHVCLLNLRDQTYPGSDGTATKGWPTWTTPVLRWAKAQGAVTGYAHSAERPGRSTRQAAAERLLAASTRTRRLLSPRRGRRRPPARRLRGHRRGPRRRPDGGGAGQRSPVGRGRQLPNLAIPEMNGVGAMEILVTVAAGPLRLHQRHGHAADRRSGTAGITC